MTHSSTSFIFISDTHIGNKYGVCTPTPETGEDDRQYQPTERQLKLYNGFQKCLERIKQPKKIRALFCGGDMVDGINPKKPGQDLWTIDPLVAVYDFNKLLWPIAQKAQEVFCIRGSDYHVSPGRDIINYDELAAQIIGADPYRTGLYDKEAIGRKIKALQASGKRLADIKSEDLQRAKNHKLAKKLQSQDNIFKKEISSLKGNVPYPVSDVRFKGIFGGVAIVLKHYVSFSPNYMYRGTGLIRNDMIQTMQKDRHFPGGYSKIIYAYGHAHYYHISGNATHYNFVIPCFKSNDTYLKANGITEPDYGMVEVIVEPNEDVIVFPYVLSGDDYPVDEPYNLSN